jgi:phosphoglycerol transferase MdoB-like AlkP superfamily enzyme
MELFRDSLPSAHVANQPATFKFIHLEGTHIPIRLDENLNEINTEYSRESFIRQATGVVRLLAVMVQRLAELGIYDNSVILVVGDHGSGRDPGMWLYPTDKTNKTFNRFKARGCPLFLAKPVGAAADTLQFSSAPVSLTDVPPTILGELGISPAQSEPSLNGLPGDVPFSEARSVFSIEEGESRIRGYYGYAWARFEPSYLPPISEFIIDGNVRSDASWQAGRMFVAE